MDTERVPAFAALDWGTSRLRLWLLDKAGEVLAERRTDEGLAVAGAKGFAGILEAHLAAMGAGAGVPAIVCGMAGSRQGWREAPYIDTPASFDDIATNALVVPGILRDVRILPGVAQRDAARPDVMRGEETQLMGALEARNSDGLVCMPGTHCKWVRAEGGRLTAFSTFLTGELFAVISRHSILSHAVEKDAAIEDDAFSQAVQAALKAPASFTHRLFAVRAGQLLGLSEKRSGAAELSGLLIGTEIAGARELWNGMETIRLVASGPLSRLYRKALEMAGFVVEEVDADTAVRRGLFMAASAIWANDRMAPGGK